MKHKIWTIALGAFAAGMLVEALAIGFGAGRALDPVAPAEAQTFSPGQVYALSTDKFLATTNASGDQVFLWYFERTGRKEASRIYYVATATTAGPKMD